jgi:hypothetical protein
MDTPAGALQALKERLADAEREMQVPTHVSERARIEEEIQELRRQIAAQEHVVADPQAARQRTEESNASGLEPERQPEYPPERISDPERQTPPRIFLCYRRQDTQWAARSIYDKLSEKYDVFRDIDSTPAGVKYSTWIESRVGQCDVMIVLIGGEWLSVDDAGRRRLDLPKDWVRQEIEAALKRDVPVIPVLVQGAPMPSDEELPSSIADLTMFNAAEITDSRWNYDLERLLNAIEQLAGSGES